MSNRNLILAAGGAPSGPTDPNFKETVLLLHGDGTNGAQNNTFLDSSTNNFTITRNGNTTQGTFSPFSADEGKWSNYFNGSTDYLSFADSADFAMGAGDFTIEGFIFTTVASTRQIFIGQGNNQDANLSFFVEITSTGKLAGTIGNGSVLSTATGATTVPVNAWNHFAYVRDGNTCRIYLNGIEDGTDDVTGVTMKDSSFALGVGRVGDWNANYFKGYISNIRAIKGTCLYPNGTTFTVPTSPFSTSATNQKLLTCYSNRFVDANTATTAKAVTVNGTPSVQPFSPFAPSAAYSASVNGGSGYFDGSGDYLTISHSSAFEFGSGDFTVEFWAYAPNATIKTIVSQGDTTAGWSIWHYDGAAGAASGKITVFLNGTGFSLTSTTNAIIPDQWNHIAVVRNGSTVTIYSNGVSVGSAGSAPTIANGTASFYVAKGAWSPYGEWTGTISGLRILKGTAQYTANFTPPTAPPTAITNTSLLLNFTNAGIFDNTGKNNLETVADAQIDTTTKKYGTGSMEFDGTGDWLLLANNVNQQLGTGNFTIEFWVYLASGDTGSNRGLVAKGTSTTGFLVSLNTTEKVVFTYATSTITSSGAITTNAWNHIAVVREGTGSNETKIYIAGTNDGTGTVSTDFNQTSVMYVGANRTGGDPMKGFIDDLRITKGVARYTTGFTPATAAFPDL